MGRTLVKKLKEAFFSVLPVTLIVLVLSLTPLASFTWTEIGFFLISAAFLILGIGMFNLGADLSMTPIGECVGVGLTRSRRLSVLLPVCFVMGVLITVAEPDLSVLADQVSAVLNGTVMIFTVGAGVGLFLMLAVLQIVIRHNLSAMLMFLYMAMFMLMALQIESGNQAMLALAADAGGVTTGPITVPFLMALGFGIAETVGGKHSNENSFGLIALCSVGPILAVLCLSLFSNGTLTYELADYSMESHLGIHLLGTVLETAWDVGKALGLVVLFFLILQVTVLKLPLMRLYRIATGIGFTFVGLVTFLTAVTVGFMPIGFKLGTELAAQSPTVLVLFALILGAVVVLAEPAVHVLNRQVEEITAGAVTRRSMMIALSVGVGLSIGLSVIRVLCGFSLLYYLIPGYIVSLGLSFFVPGIYTAIAFDSGGVASGPLTSSFILPLIIGVCNTLCGTESILSLAFGVVSMVAMTPLITIQLLGFRSVVAKRVRNRMAIRQILAEDDEQVIEFGKKGERHG